MMSIHPDIKAPLRIEAALSDGERRALLSAIEELRYCLAAANDGDVPIEVRFHSALSAIPLDSRPALIVASLLLELTEPEETLAAIEARLRDTFSALTKDGSSAVFLCTIFRRIDPEAMMGDPVAAGARMERIRRLNLLAIELSHDFDINIIDFDRSFAHIGGRSLGTDFKLQGSAAVVAAQHLIASTFFAAGLDDFCSPELQETTKAIYEQRRRGIVVPTRPVLSAGTLRFSQINKGKRLQTFATNRNRRSFSDLWLNLITRRTTATKTLQIVLRAARRRLRNG